MKKEELENGIEDYAASKSAQAIEDTQWVKYRGAKTGHGFAAEDANALNEKLKFKRVDKTGLNNELNGPDRVTNGQKIQTKYYATGSKSVGAAFDKKTGLYKYNNQMIEVPKDQHTDALAAMKEKIREGKVPGINDPEKAKDLIKQGDVTHMQSQNIARAGNIDSLWFDIKNQCVVSSCAFGISFVIQCANGIWNGLEPKKAAQIALLNSIKTGKIVLISGVVSSQFLRTSLGRSFAALNTRIAKKIVSKVYSTKVGKDIIENMASAILKKTLYGAAAKNAVSKMLRSNVVTATVTTIVLTVPDLYKTIISRHISWAQLGKNFIVTASGAAGGAGGAALGAALGTAICPGAGTVIGGLIGGISGGIGASAGAKKVTDIFIEDDAKIMVELMNEEVKNLCVDYMVTVDELENIIIPQIKEIVNKKWLQEMYKYGGSRKHSENLSSEYAINKLEPTFIDVLQRRPKVKIPNRATLVLILIEMKLRLLFTFLIKILVRFPFKTNKV